MEKQSISLKGSVEEKIRYCVLSAFWRHWWDTAGSRSEYSVIVTNKRQETKADPALVLDAGGTGWWEWGHLSLRLISAFLQRPAWTNRDVRDGVGSLYS